MPTTLPPDERFYDILKAHGQLIVDGIVRDAVPTLFGGDIMIGWPDQNELAALRRGADPIVALYPTEPARDVSRYRPGLINGTVVWTPAPLVATVTDNEIVFSGTAPAGITVHTFVGAPRVDVAYVTVNGDTPATVAAAIHALLVAGDFPPGVTSILAGASLTIDSPYVNCSVAGTGTALRRIAQRDDRFLVVVWATDETQRGLIVQAIRQNMGTQDEDAFIVPIGDGTTSWTRAAWGPRYKNEGAATQMLKRADLAFDSWYDLVKKVNVFQSISFGITMQTPDGTTNAVEG